MVTNWLVNKSLIKSHNEWGISSGSWDSPAEMVSDQIWNQTWGQVEAFLWVLVAETPNED